MALPFWELKPEERSSWYRQLRTTDSVGRTPHTLSSGSLDCVSDALSSLPSSPRRSVDYSVDPPSDLCCLHPVIILSISFLKDLAT